MFYKIIEKKRDQWLNSPDCIVADIITYMEHQHRLRDAQIEAIKTYLYLKIACHNQPLWKLLAEGVFLTTNADDLEVKQETRQVLASQPAALALWEYATMRDEHGVQQAPALEKAIRNAPHDVDYLQVLRAMFSEKDYTDYLFSLPMGAGKTYLMAALIYLNLYFALTEPDNRLFAHNFLILVPSGLKTSIIPSLRDMQHFDPTWILPDPVATQLSNMLQYEWLQDASTASGSNMVRNPNARKISMHTANPNLMGLVAVTNAEKVILDRVDKEGNLNSSLWNTLSEEEKKEYMATQQANELREQIGGIPNLCILIDEVHHASDDQKLRRVVNDWMAHHDFNSVLGFSGTPNMDPPLKVAVHDDLTIKCTQLANVVTYYPLIQGIGNFLKRPTVRYADLESESIIEHGVQEFLALYLDRTYTDGTTAKLAIYAPSIEDLEERVFPQVCSLCEAVGLNPNEAVLKFHNGNKQYKAPEEAKFEFEMLDSPLSSKRIILLVGIGREGWNCKSLTSVILSQRNACPQNMVLQISCRCLREVDNATQETATIWLNKWNADKLNAQLQAQQYTSIEAINGLSARPTQTIHRYSRMEQVQLPPIDYYQMRIDYKTVVVSQPVEMSAFVNSYEPPLREEDFILTQDFSGEIVSEGAAVDGQRHRITFREWIDRIVKESFGTLSLAQLQPLETDLQRLFTTRLCDAEGYLRADIRHEQVRADIRKAFVPQRTFQVEEELVPEEASLLQVNALTSPVVASSDAIYTPPQQRVEEIIHEDAAPHGTISDEVRAYLLAHHLPLPEDHDINNRTFHYLPYHMDSRLEVEYLNRLIPLLKELPKVEIYYNGDDTLTEFKIRCYSHTGKAWKLLGYYYPDFILLTRNEAGAIDKVVIVETKGEGFAGKFVPRRQFMEETFIRLNNERYGRERFRFLYLEDTLKMEQQIQQTHHVIQSFLLK